MKKRLLCFLSLITFVLLVFGINFDENIQKSKAASNTNIMGTWTTIKGPTTADTTHLLSSNTKMMIVATTDPIVGYKDGNYTNKVDGLVGGDEFYVTVFLDCSSTKNLFALGMGWKFDSSEIDTITDIISSSSYSQNIINETDGNRRGFILDYMDASSSWDDPETFSSATAAMTNLYGHTGANYLEGEAKSILYENSMSSGANLVSNTRVAYNSATENGNTLTMSANIYVVGKFKVKLKAGVTTFSMTCDTMSVSEKKGDNNFHWNNGYTSGGAADLTLYNASIGAGSASENVDTSITVTDGSGSSLTVPSIQKSYSDTHTSDDFIFEIDNGSSNYYLEAIVDGGKGTVTGSSSNAVHDNTNAGKYKYNITDSIGQSSFTEVTINVQAQDSIHNATYKIRIIRKANLSSLTLKKPTQSNLSDPILSTSSNQNDYASGSNKITNTSNLTPGTTYYIWIPSSLSSYDVEYTHTGAAGSINGDQVASGSNTSIQSSVGSFSILIAADNSNVSSASIKTEYKFVVKKITEYTGIANPTVTVTGDSTTQGTAGNNSTTNISNSQTSNGTSLSSGGTLYNYNIPFQDASGNKVTSVDVITKPSNTANSKIYYSTDGGQTWITPGSDYKVTLPLNEDSTGNASGTIYYYVEDNATGAVSKIHGVTVTRTPGDSDSTYKVISVYNVTTGTDVLLSRFNPGDNLDVGTYQLVNVSKIKIVVEANSSNVKNIEINGNQGTSNPYSYTDNFTRTGTFTYPIKITPQTGNPGAYSVSITIEDNRSSDTFMKHFYVSDDDGPKTPESNSIGKDTIQNNGRLESPVTLYYNVPYGSSNLIVTAVADKGNVYKDQQDNGIISNINVSSLIPGQPTTYTYVVKSELGTYSAPYKIIITRQTANNKVGMKDLQVNCNGVYTFTNIQTGTAFSDETNSLHTSSTTLYFYTNLGTTASGFTLNSIVANEVSGLNINKVPPVSAPTLTSNGITLTYILQSEDRSVSVTYILYIYASNTISDFDSTGAYLRVLDSQASGVTNGTITGSPTLLQDCITNDVYDKEIPSDPPVTPWSATINYSNRRVFIDYLLNNNAKMYIANGSQYQLFKGSNQDITCAVPANGSTQSKTTVVKLYVFSELQLARIALEQSLGTTYQTFVNANESKMYEFTFNVNPKCNKNTLHNFIISTGTGDVTFTPDDSSATLITIENIGSTTNLVFEVEKTCKDHEHKLTYGGAQQYGNPVSLGNGKYQITYSCNWNQSQETTTISIESEDGTPLVYTIQMSSGNAQLDTDKTLGLTTITGFKTSSSANGSQSYNKVPSATSLPGESTSLKVGDTFVKVTPKLPSGSLATIKLGYNFDGTSTFTNEPLDSNGDAYITVSPDINQVKYLYLQISVTCQDTSISNPTDYYYIKIEIPKVSNDNTITQFKVDGNGKTPDATFSTYFDISKTIKDNCSFSFTLSDPNSTANVITNLTAISNINYQLNNPSDNTSGILSGLALGENIIKVDVTSTSGQVQPYFVYIWVNEDVYLDNLEVKSVDNQTTHQLSPQFAKNTNPYTTTVPYADTQENVYYTINNLNLNVIQVYYTIGTDPTIKYFDNSNCALVNLASSGSTMVNVTVTQKYPASWNYQGSTPSSKTYNVEIKKQTASTDKDLLSIDIKGNLENSSHIYTQADLSTSNPITLVFDRDTQLIELTNVTHNGKNISINVSNNATYVAKVRQNNTDPYAWDINNLNPATKYTLTISVEDEGRNSNSYIFYLILADNSHDITDLKFVDAFGNLQDDDNGDNINFSVGDLNYRLDTSLNPDPYVFAAAGTIIKVTKSQYSYVYVNGVIQMQSYGSTTYDVKVNLSNFTPGQSTPIKIMVISELEKIQPQNPQSKSDEYVVYVGKVQLDSNSALHELNITIIGSNSTDITSSATMSGSYTPDQPGNYTINYSNVGEALSFSFSAKPFKSTTSVQFLGVQNGPGQTLNDNVILNSSTNNGYILTYVITSIAQDGVSKSTYTINITRGPLNPSDDNTITGLKFFDSSSNYYVGEASNSPSVAVFDPINHIYPQPYGGYNITIPYGTASFTIDASIYAGSGASIIFTKDGNALSNTTLYSYQESLTNNSSIWGQTYTYIVQAKSQSGLLGKQYAFIVTFEAPKANFDLDELKVDNGTNLIIAGPDTKSADNLTWTWTNVKTVDYSTTYVDIYAYIADPTATILSSSDIGTKQLNVGNNTFVVTVRAQNGDERKYILNIYRNAKNPTLLDLEVTGQQLLDQNGQAISFDPNVTEYYVTIPYNVTSAEVVVKVTDPVNQIVYPGNSTTPSTVATVLVQPGTTEVQTMRVYDQTSGLSTPYTVYITRLNEDSVNADLDKVIIDKLDGVNSSLGELDDKNNVLNSFEDDWNKDRLHYGIYTVDNVVSSLDIDATAIVSKPSTYCPTAATVEVFGGKLQIGENVISIVVTAPDGETKKVYDIVVYREPIAYEVDEKAINDDGYKLTVKENLIDYTIDIGKKKTHEVDFKEYIKLLNDVTDQDVEINYLTNIDCDPDDVIVELVTKDGISTLVTFHVLSTGNSHTGSGFMDYLPLLIGLLIVIILLTCILISVNKDKYGKITRKADKKADKNQKNASKK